MSLKVQSKYTPATTKDAFYKIVKELEFIQLQSMSLFPKIEIRVHPGMSVQDFLEYTVESAAEILKVQDAVLVHMFLYRVFELDELSVKMVSKLLKDNDHLIQWHVNNSQMNKRLFSQPFSKLSSFEKREEYRAKFLLYFEMFCSEISEVNFLYVDPTDTKFNDKMINLLLKKGAFNSVGKTVQGISWAAEKFLIDLNNRDFKTLLSLVKTEKDVENALDNLTVNEKISLNPVIDEYFQDKFIKTNPMLQYVDPLWRSYASMRKQLATIPSEIDSSVFQEVSLKSFLSKNYGFKGSTLAKSYTNFMKDSKGFKLANHVVVGRLLKKVFAQYETTSEMEVPYSNYIVSLLNDSNTVQALFDNRESVMMLTKILSPSQLHTILSQLNTAKQAQINSIFDNLYKILNKSSTQNLNRFYKYRATKKFHEINTLALLNTFLNNEVQECLMTDKRIAKNVTSDLLKFDNHDLGEGFTVSVPRSVFELADLRLEIGQSVVKKYAHELNQNSFVILNKDSKVKYFVNIGEADERTVLFNPYFEKTRPAENDFENQKALIEIGDEVIMDCLSMDKKGKVVNSVLDLPNEVFKNLCIVLAKCDLLSEKYFALNIKAKTMTKDFVFELKDQGIVESTSIELLSWQLDKVFRKDVDSKIPKVPEVIAVSFLDWNLMSVNKVFASQTSLITDLMNEYSITESFAKDFVAYICDSNLPWDTDLKQVGPQMDAFIKNLEKDVLIEIGQNGRSYPELVAHLKSHMLLARIISKLVNEGIILFDGDMYAMASDIRFNVQRIFGEKEVCVWNDLKNVSKLDKQIVRQFIDSMCNTKMERINREWTVVYTLKEEFKLFGGIATQSIVR